MFKGWYSTTKGHTRGFNPRVATVVPIENKVFSVSKDEFKEGIHGIIGVFEGFTCTLTFVCRHTLPVISLMSYLSFPCRLPLVFTYHYPMEERQKTRINMDAYYE